MSTPWKSICCAAKRNQKCRWAGFAPELFYRYCVRGTRRCRDENRWRWPARGANWIFSDVAKQMRRLSGARCGAARQGVLVAADADGYSVSDKDNIARVVSRKAKKQGDVTGKEERTPRKNRSKVKGGGQALNGFYRRTGVRRRFCECNSQYHLASKFPRVSPKCA